MAECGKKDTCKNYDKKCSACWASSSIYDTYPCYTSKDLVEVVRCKDCCHYKQNPWNTEGKPGQLDLDLLHQLDLLKQLRSLHWDGRITAAGALYRLMMDKVKKEIEKDCIKESEE